MRTYVFHITLTDPTRDLTWNAYIIIIVSALELYIGIVSNLFERVTSRKTRNSRPTQQICASVPAIKPFVARYLPIMLENPRYWLSKQSESRRDPFDRPSAAGKGLEPDFWLVTRDSVATFQDIESASGLVLQMQPRPPMPGMPTPTRPPRTASTLQTGAALSTITTATTASNKTTTTDDNLSVASAASAVPAPLRVAKSPRASTASSQRPDLNKPLPRIGTAVLDASFAAEAQKHMSSVYQFIPHEDGHISVHKARKSAFGNG